MVWGVSGGVASVAGASGAAATVERSSCLCTRGTNRVAGQYVLCAAEAATRYGKLRHAVMSTCAVVLEAARTSVG